MDSYFSVIYGRLSIAIGAVNHGAITASLDACAEQPGTITKWV